MPGFESGACYWGDAQFLGWANAHWRWLEIEKIRDQAGWEELQEEDSPAGLHGWHAPCGTHEDAWRELGRPMPEDAPAAEPALIFQEPSPSALIQFEVDGLHFIVCGVEVFRLTPDGMEYKGQTVKDAGVAYQQVTEFFSAAREAMNGQLAGEEG